MSGRADRWSGLKKVLLAGPGEAPSGPETEWAVETSRAYRDRLVLKLGGIGDANEADALKGRWVLVPAGEVPELPEGEYYMDRLIGLEVEDARIGPVGTISDVLETGGVDLLVVRNQVGSEILVPLAQEIVTEVSEAEGKVRVRLPEGLLEDQA